MTKPVQIGWREWVELPDWDLVLKAKIDTGAKSSSIDVSNIQPAGEGFIQFDIHTYRKKEHTQTVKAEIFKQTKVRSSNGQMQERYVVKTPMILGGVKKEILVSLTSRRKMLHRMLLGREALQHDFLIDAGVDHLVGSLKKKNRRS